MLLVIVKGVLREKTEAICKMMFMVVCVFQLSMLFLVSISMNNQELYENYCFGARLVAICQKSYLTSKSNYSTLFLYKALC